jgi:hypothetical protein
MLIIGCNIALGVKLGEDQLDDYNSALEKKEPVTLPDGTTVQGSGAKVNTDGSVTCTGECTINNNKVTGESATYSSTGGLTCTKPCTVNSEPARTYIGQTMSGDTWSAESAKTPDGREYVKPESCQGNSCGNMQSGSAPSEVDIGTKPPDNIQSALMTMEYKLAKSDKTNPNTKKQEIQGEFLIGPGNGGIAPNIVSKKVDTKYDEQPAPKPAAEESKLSPEAKQTAEKLKNEGQTDKCDGPLGCGPNGNPIKPTASDDGFSSNRIGTFSTPTMQGDEMSGFVYNPGQMYADSARKLRLFNTTFDNLSNVYVEGNIVYVGSGDVVVDGNDVYSKVSESWFEFEDGKIKRVYAKSAAPNNFFYVKGNLVLAGEDDDFTVTYQDEGMLIYSNATVEFQSLEYDETVEINGSATYIGHSYKNGITCTILGSASRYKYNGTTTEFSPFALYVPSAVSYFQLCLRKELNDTYTAEHEQQGVIDFVDGNATLLGIYEYEKLDRLNRFTDIIAAEHSNATMQYRENMRS